MQIQEVITIMENDRSRMWTGVGDFLDRFYNILTDKERHNVLHKEPKWYEGVDIYDKTFISAMVEKLAIDYNLDVPKWTYNKEYFEMEKPHFAMNAKGDLRLILLKESPKPFRMRNIYTTANVLDRA